MRAATSSETGFDGSTSPYTSDVEAIDLYVDDGSLVADVFRNTISFDGGTWGVRARGIDAAGLDLRIVGNAIELVNLDAGGAAIEVTDTTTSDGIVDTQIVNNTVRYSGGGIVLKGDGDALVANNLLTHIFDAALSVDGAGISNRNNLFFHDLYGDVEGTTAGPGSVFADPGLTEDDFRILPSSPAADAGDSASLPPDFTTDLYGDPRVQGASVDIGAVEAPEPPAALSSALAIAACARRSPRGARRRRSG